jgi:hypothetical protein
MKNLKKRLASGAVLIGAISLPIRPAAGWVACGGFFHPPVVVCHPAPCYAGVGMAAVAGFAAGAAVASAAHPTVVVAPQPVVVAPQPVVVAPASVAPAIGTSVTVLPPGSQATTIGGVHYYLCNGAWYRPFFGSNGVYYEVVSAP